MREQLHVLSPRQDRMLNNLIDWHGARGNRIAFKSMHMTSTLYQSRGRVKNDHVVMVDGCGRTKDYFWHKEKHAWRGQMGDSNVKGLHNWRYTL